MTAPDHAMTALQAELTRFVAERPPERIAEALSHGAYIYGAGGYGRRIAALLAEKGFPCLGFLDRKATAGAQLDGLPLLHPDSLSPAQVEGRCFLLGLHNHYLDTAPILAFANSLPFREILLNADLPDALGDAADNYWLCRRAFLLENFDRLRAVAARFSDPASQQLFRQLIRFRVTGADMPRHDLASQYFPPDLPAFNRPITLVDGGAYTGDSYRGLDALGIQLDHWIAFEPDQDNFRQLAECARSYKVRSTLFPCGLSDRLHQVFFQDNQGLGSRIVEDAAQASGSILCVALDEVIQGVTPDYIKLDVEGAERAALLGMSRTIAAARPRLAVSAYHKPGDLWDVPEQMLEMLPEASLHLRQHGFSAFDSVMYAVP